MYVDTGSQRANMKVFWNVGCLECNNESVGVSAATRVVVTVMLVMAETPWGLSSLSVSSSSQSTSWAHLITPLQVLKNPVRAGCDWAASQVVQLVHYSTLDSRSNFQKEMTISE